MKLCPYCGARYPDEVFVCVTDANLLRNANENGEVARPRRTRFSWRSLRGGLAVFLGLLVLAATLPCAGAIMPGPSPVGMWRCGPFVFYPGALLMTVSVVMSATGCTLYGLRRNQGAEVVGWILLGSLVLFVFCA